MNIFGYTIYVMPNWVFYAVLGAAVNTVANFVDKLVLEKYVKNYKGLAIFSAIVGFIVGTIIWASTGFHFLTLSNSLIALSVGVLTLIATAIYFKALQGTSTSSVILIFQFIPFLVLVLAMIFLKETLTVKSVVGFFLILIPAVLISWQGGRLKDFKVDKSLWLVLVVDVLWAIAVILMKYVTETQTFSSLIAYESWGWGLGGLILVTLFPKIREAFLENIKGVGKKGLSLIVVNEFIYVFSKLLGFLALSLGPVYIVSVLGSTQVFFAVIFGLVLGLIAPKIFKEDNTKRGLVKKAVCSVLIFAGVMLVS